VTNEGIVPLPDGRNDYDWFRWEAAQPGVFTVAQKTTASGPLELHLFNLQGNTLVPLGNVFTPNGATSTISTSVVPGQVILVEVKGENTSIGVMSQGIYNLTATLS
jgi:hypothetical protein